MDGFSEWHSNTETYGCIGVEYFVSVFWNGLENVEKYSLMVIYQKSFSVNENRILWLFLPFSRLPRSLSLNSRLKRVILTRVCLKNSLAFLPYQLQCTFFFCFHLSDFHSDEMREIFGTCGTVSKVKLRRNKSYRSLASQVYCTSNRQLFFFACL